jgi:hypothetical protein
MIPITVLEGFFVRAIGCPDFICTQATPYHRFDSGAVFAGKMVNFYDDQFAHEW